MHFFFQGPECTDEAVIDSWRVTVCKAKDRNDSENTECRNLMSQIRWIERAEWSHRGSLEIMGLQECQLYTVAITPTHRFVYVVRTVGATNNHSVAI